MQQLLVLDHGAQLGQLGDVLGPSSRLDPLGDRFHDLGGEDDGDDVEDCRAPQFAAFVVVELALGDRLVDLVKREQDDNGADDDGDGQQDARRQGGNKGDGGRDSPDHGEDRTETADECSHRQHDDKGDEHDKRDDQQDQDQHAERFEEAGEEPLRE